MKTAFLCIGLALAFTGCARYAHGSAKVALGMTRPEVRRACGLPYSQTMRGAVEHWFYHDTAWHGSESGSELTSQFTDITFVGDRVASFGPAAEMPRATPRPGATPLPANAATHSAR